MALLSNNTKAVLFNDNMLDIGYVQKSRCYVVQHYDFTLNRSRNAAGEVYGFDSGSTLILNLRIGANQNLEPFYRSLSDRELTTFSFIFNAQYDKLNLVENYDSAIIVKGSLIDIEEEYNSKPGNDKPHMSIRIMILVRNVQYLKDVVCNKTDFLTYNGIVENR